MPDPNPAPSRPGLRALLLLLYPPAWRARYTDEFVETIGAHPFSVGLLVDVVAGAIDAWLHPEFVTAAAARPAAAPKGERAMIGRMLKLRCTGYGPEISTQDAWKGAGVMIALTIAFTLAWMWAHITTDDNAYVDSFAVMPFLAAYLLSMPFTSLKGRSRASKAVFIGGSLLVLTAGCLAVGFISARL